MGAMTLFGFFKGMHDANIFASVYDVIHPRARGTAAGVMNPVGWTGGAPAAAVIGWVVPRAGAAGEVAVMSRALATGGTVYLVSAAVPLIGIVLFVRRDVERLRTRLRRTHDAV